MGYELIAIALNGLAVTIALIALMTQIREQKLALQTDLLLRLSEMMDSEKMRGWRRIGSQKLLNNQLPNSEIDEVLGFLSMVGFLTKRSAIDHYWISAEGYICNARLSTPKLWESLEWLAKKQIAREQKEGYFLSLETANNFLKLESNLAI
jgi:hypothetical protein